LKFAWGLELKTNKESGSEYTRKESAQAHEQLEWLRKMHNGYSTRLSWVGRKLPVANSASPPQTLTVIELDSLRELASRVHVFYDAATGGTYDAAELQSWLEHRGLVFPRTLEALEAVAASDLQEFDIE
jgi:hypothetical protein